MEWEDVATRLYMGTLLENTWTYFIDVLIKCAHQNLVQQNEVLPCDWMKNTVNGFILLPIMT